MRRNTQNDIQMNESTTPVGFNVGAAGAGGTRREIDARCAAAPRNEKQVIRSITLRR